MTSPTPRDTHFLFRESVIRFRSRSASSVIWLFIVYSSSSRLSSLALTDDNWDSTELCAFIWCTCFDLRSYFGLLNLESQLLDFFQSQTSNFFLHSLLALEVHKHVVEIRHNKELAILDDISASLAIVVEVRHRKLGSRLNPKWKLPLDIWMNEWTDWVIPYRAFEITQSRLHFIVNHIRANTITCEGDHSLSATS